MAGEAAPPFTSKTRLDEATAMVEYAKTPDPAPYVGLVKPPDETISVAVDMAEHSITYQGLTRGKRRADAALEAITTGLPLASVLVPEHLRRIEPSLHRLLRDHPDSERNVFLMMRFRDDPALVAVWEAIRGACVAYGLTVLRADQKEYTSDLLDNVLTYIFGCRSAIAVFDQINYRKFNPNVALEVGFILSQGKPLLLLKDQAIEQMPSDIIGKIYRPFNTYQPEETIPPRVREWLDSYGLGTRPETTAETS